ncbi:hypothetical protein ABDB81_13630 [Cupriavidus sp. DL-D2]
MSALLPAICALHAQMVRFNVDHREDLHSEGACRHPSSGGMALWVEPFSMSALPPLSATMLGSADQE